MSLFTTKTDNVDDVMAADVNILQDCQGSEGQTGIAEGRLTLTTATPVTTADVTAATTVYYTPYVGSRVSLYNGSTGWATHNFTEKSVAVPATTNTPFDIFGFASGGALALQALSWTNDTTRATALTRQDGVYVKTGATGYRYLGTCRTTGTSGQCEDSEARCLLWNYYNRVWRALHKNDSSSHTYGTATYRSWNNDATLRVDCIVGVLEEYVIGSIIGDTTAGSGLLAYTGIGLNVTNNSNANPSINSTTRMRVGTTSRLLPTLGYNYFQMVELGSGSTPTFTAAFMHILLRR